MLFGPRCSRIRIHANEAALHPPSGRAPLDVEQAVHVPPTRPAVLEQTTSDLNGQLDGIVVAAASPQLLRTLDLGHAAVAVEVVDAADRGAREDPFKVLVKLLDLLAPRSR